MPQNNCDSANFVFTWMSQLKYLLHAVLILAVMAWDAPADDSQRSAELARAELNIKKVKTAVEEGRYKEADPLARQALAIREKYLGSAYPQVAEALGICAYVQKSLGNYAEAESLYKRAGEQTEKAVGSDHQFVANPLLLLAGVYCIEGKFADAELAVRRARSIREKAFG